MSAIEIKLATVILLRSIVYSHQDYCSVLVIPTRKDVVGEKFTYGKWKLYKA